MERVHAHFIPGILSSIKVLSNRAYLCSTISRHDFACFVVAAICLPAYLHVSRNLRQDMILHVLWFAADSSHQDTQTRKVFKKGDEILQGVYQSCEFSNQS